MLRITSVHDFRGPGLKLEGKLLEPWIDELRTACAAELAKQAARPRLDLTAVSFVDAAGAALLEELRRTGFDLAECSGYVAAILRSEKP
jgi:ABC-type transporter Mla MlaB component